MALWSPTVDDLAGFTGEVGASYEPFVQRALSDAVLLFSWASCIEELPDQGTNEGDLIRNGILAMADSLYTSQDQRNVTSGPFQSETIGSYSYSLRQATQAVQASSPTGVGWFDMAVEFLGVCSRTRNTVLGSSKILFEDDLPWHTHTDGKIHLLGPADFKQPFPPSWWSIPKSYVPDGN